MRIVNGEIRLAATDVSNHLACRHLTGLSTIVWGNDYPHHDAVYPGAVKCVKERGLGEELERKVLADNALAFYGDRLRGIIGESGR